MAKNDLEFVRSDAWLLLAVLLASREHYAPVEKIIEAGDYINRDIFSDEELNGGFTRLKAGGFVKERGGKYSATSKTLKAYAKTTTPRRAIYKELEDMRQLLGV
ncbi:MAG: hypothetical protein M3268_02560 [Acidobacteriota bacterium]|nr:hypothetical protein [Acidobacteriota bacterium]